MLGIYPSQTYKLADNPSCVTVEDNGAVLPLTECGSWIEANLT